MQQTNIISADQIKDNDMARTCGHHEREVMVGKPEGKRLLGRPSYRREDIKMEEVHRTAE